MTRYTQPGRGGGNGRFGAGRPPLELIPEPLAKLLLERDRIGIQRHKAEERAAVLVNPGLDTQADAADADAAQAAARAGKRIPAATAVADLATERATAARELDAQQAAYDAITEEADRLATDGLYWPRREASQKARDAARARIEKQAHKLADAVEAAIAEQAADAWLQGGSYDAQTPRTWPTELVDFRPYGIDRGRTQGHLVTLRDAILRAATTGLDSE